MKLKKILATTTLLSLIFLTGLISLVFNPAPLFAERITHEKFDFFHNGTVDLTGLEGVLDQSYHLISQSELHDPKLRFPIFLTEGTLYDRLENLQGVGPIARATAGNIAVKCKIDVPNNQAFNKRNVINLTELLAHEMIHVLQAHQFAYRNFGPWKHPPMWKLEGYPEYIGRQTRLRKADYSLKAELARYQSLERKSKDNFVEVVPGHWAPAYYYKGRIMIEYLMDVRHLSYSAILQDERTEEAVYQEFIEWATAKVETTRPQ